MAYHKPKGDVSWFAGKRKKPIAYSTVASSDLIKLLFDEHPDATIQEVQGMINFDEEAKQVLQKYMDLGYGNDKLYGRLY